MAKSPVQTRPAHLPTVPRIWLLGATLVSIVLVVAVAGYAHLSDGALYAVLSALTEVLKVGVHMV